MLHPPKKLAAALATIAVSAATMVAATSTAHAAITNVCGGSPFDYIGVVPGSDTQFTGKLTTRGGTDSPFSLSMVLGTSLVAADTATGSGSAEQIDYDALEVRVDDTGRGVPVFNTAWGTAVGENVECSTVGSPTRVNKITGRVNGEAGAEFTLSRV